MFIRNFAGMRTAAGLAMVCAASAARAGVEVPPGGSIDYAPLASSVPTLGAWTLLMLALLVAAVAYRVLRGRVNGRLLSNLFVVGGVAAAGVAGHDLVQRAEAISADPVNLSSSSGGSVSGNRWVQATNTSGVPQQIKAIRPNADWVLVIEAPEEPQCQVGTVVQPGAKCNVRFEYQPT